MEGMKLLRIMSQGNIIQRVTRSDGSQYWQCVGEFVKGEVLKPLQQRRYIVMEKTAEGDISFSITERGKEVAKRNKAGILKRMETRLIVKRRFGKKPIREVGGYESCDFGDGDNDEEG
jgi:DNA-binding PadR family transcriptional regulator